MATITVLCTLIAFFTLTDCYGLYEHRPPKIIGYENKLETVVTSGRKLILECEGTEQVTWHYPNNTVDKTIWSQVDIEVSFIRGKHGARLTLSNASFVDTGFYYCHYARLELNIHDEKQVAKVYVYVEDREHLSANPDNFIFLQVPQFSTVIIPCRPTSPDIHVSLTEYGSDDESDYIYNPTQGFNITIGSYERQFICTFTRGDQETELNSNVIPIMLPEKVDQPYIFARNLTSIGDSLTLQCKVHIDPNVFFEISWEVPQPSGFDTKRIIATKTKKNEDQNYGEANLTISKIEAGDAGEYKCIVKDHANNTNFGTKTIKVLPTNVSIITLTEEYGVHEINYTVNGKQHDGFVQWNIKVTSHPKAKIIWLNNRNNTIDTERDDDPTKKYYATLVSDESALLKIYNVDLNDAGVYILKAYNDLNESSLSLRLTVFVKPTVDIESNDYYQLNETAVISCNAVGYPLPTIKWYYKSCLEKCNFEELPARNFTTTEESWRTTSTVYLTALNNGYVKCVGNNNQGEDNNIVGFFVTDIKSGFDVWGLNMVETEGRQIATVTEGDTVTLHCGASVHNYTDDIQWYKKSSNNETTDQDEIIIKNNTKYSIVNTRTKFTNRVSLTINHISKKERGYYLCKTFEKIYQTPKQLIFFLQSQEELKPKIYKSNLNDSEFKVNMLDPLTLTCLASGRPQPTIRWFKDDREWPFEMNATRILLSNDNTTVNFTFTHSEDEGVYSCVVSSRLGSVKRQMTLTVLSKSKTDNVVISVLIIMSIFFLFVVVVLVLRLRKENREQKELRAAGLANFEKGALDNLNPDLGVDDQAELLPYDKKWEFPRDRLKLGKQLGSGAFGVVMKAEAQGISEGEAVTTVAVKMVKRNAESTFIKALASELKIMVHLGKNLNVVNLLGACTKNVAKKELLVIVEYCQFGNLHNYLLRHRENFIDQIDPKTGMIDINIGAEILSRSLSMDSNQGRFKYAALSFGSGSSKIPTAGVDYRAAQNPSNNSDTAVCMSPSPTSAGDEICYQSSSGTQQPEWRSNYRGDYNRGNVKPICTSDLLCWAFQVARGMDYLASRKVLHGDLAARNILLAEDNIVKICDFGLAKSMYKSDNYKKKGDGPLPIKWMAVESISDRVFSTQSDVWSFGIVLWEFFSLARTPYPGMEADERLYHKLVGGFRMDSPQYSTKELYEIMKRCWHAKPTERPSFDTLSENLGSMLNDTVRNHYIDLNNPYISMNNQMFHEGHSDYLLMLNAPDYGNLASPQKPTYVNDVRFSELAESNGEASGYLCMKPDIFSPRPEDEKSAFAFDVPKKEKLNGESATRVELLPILHTNDFSDSELSPTLPKSFSNPSYQKGLTINDDVNNKDIVKTSDNYINMPKQKVLMKNDKNLIDDELSTKFNDNSYNDSTNVLNEDTNRHYVNSQSRDWERPIFN